MTAQRRARIIAIAAVIATLGTARATDASAFNLDFGTEFGTPADSFGAAAGQAGYWNQVAAGAGSVALSNLAGGATGTSVSISGPVTNDFTGSATVNADFLMQDYFRGTFEAATWLVSFAGLANGSYDVFLYDSADSDVSTGSGTVNGTPYASINGAYASPALILDSNYLLLQNVLVVDNTLSVYGNGLGGTAFSGLAGIQLRDSLSPVPEPSTLGLLALGAAGLYAHRRRVRRIRGAAV